MHHYYFPVRVQREVDTECRQSSVSTGLKADLWVMSRSKFRYQVLVMVHVINNRGVVTLEQRLHEEAQCPDHTHAHKDPQKESVDHHGNILPVFNDLQEERTS